MEKVTGRAKGGLARAEKLSKERRKEIGRRGAEVRRELAGLPKAIYGSVDKPIKIGGIEIAAYVLENETRVLSQRGLQTGIGMSAGGGSTAGEQRLAVFFDSLAAKGLDISDLAARIRNPIKFVMPQGGVAFGYEATILADICDAVLAARSQRLLQPQQARFADQCEILVRGFARVGIVALVDEATGFSLERDKANLAKILEAFVAKEIQPYIKTFPSDYYEQLFRLYGLPYPPPGNSSWRPQFFGKITNEVVYARLAPNLIPELKKIASKTERRAKMHQALTRDIGHPKLREHLASIVAIQKLSSSPAEFLENVSKVHPRYGQTLPLFEDLIEKDAAISDSSSALPPPSSQ